jgi:hypothetical protein
MRKLVIAKLCGATRHRFGHRLLKDWTEISGVDSILTGYTCKANGPPIEG